MGDGIEMNDRQHLDEAVFEKLRHIGGDQFMGEIFTLFLDSAPVKIEEAVAGSQGGDLELVERAVHSLRSSAGNIGAQRLQDLCGQIEIFAVEGDSDSLAPLIDQLGAAFERVRGPLETARNAVIPS